LSKISRPTTSLPCMLPTHFILGRLEGALATSLVMLQDMGVKTCRSCDSADSRRGLTGVPAASKVHTEHEQGGACLPCTRGWPDPNHNYETPGCKYTVRMHANKPQPRYMQPVLTVVMPSWMSIGKSVHRTRSMRRQACCQRSGLWSRCSNVSSMLRSSTQRTTM